MVDTFERPHSSAFGAYSETSHQRIQVSRLTLRKRFAATAKAAASTAVQLMHHKRLMIDGIKRRCQRQRLQRRSRASHSDTATARMQATLRKRSRARACHYPPSGIYGEASSGSIHVS